MRRSAGRRWRRYAAVALLAVCAGQGTAHAVGEAWPDSDGSTLASGRLREFALQLDNDSLATWPHNDRWYTSGAALRWVHEAGSQGLLAGVGAAWCAWTDCGDGVRAYRLTTIAHEIFNPVDNERTDAQPFDRPYAGVLSIGTGVLLREPDTLQRLDARLVVIGPGALGEPIQNGVHRALGLDLARGWNTQLRPRTGLQLGWAGLGRHGAPVSWVDWVHRLALDVGSVRARASVGAMVRFGAPPDGPSWPGEANAPWGTLPVDAGRWHLFLGADARGVAMDRTIDGPAFGYRPAVRAEPFGADVFAGASVRLARTLRLDLTMTVRSIDFDSPLGTEWSWQRYGTLQLRWIDP